MQKTNSLSNWIVNIILIVSFISSCRNAEKNIYVISKEDSLKKVTFQNKDGVLIMPPQIPIGTYNFIIDEMDNCYLYVLPEPVGINSGIDRSDWRTPSAVELLKIPNGCEKDIIEQNIINIKSGQNTKAISVASFKDTLNSPIIPILRQLERDSIKSIYLVIRIANDYEKQLVYKKWN